MLKKFSVSNFKNYDDKVVFNLGSPSNYEFNQDIIVSNCVSKAIIYGINGSGKSNLALAIFDIIIHLTDKERNLSRYLPYLNMNSLKKTAEFEYEFLFNGINVTYKYSKRNATTLMYETLEIDNKEVLHFDFVSNEGYTILEGAETLSLQQKELALNHNISRVKYIKSNALLSDTPINQAFLSFVEFVDNMLMFYSVDVKGYQGLCTGSDSFTQGIIREGKLKDFEAFLREYNINYNLIAIEMNGEKEMFCKTAKNPVLFSTIASTGTRALALFYYWYLKMGKASFVMVDEFDAFYHSELSESLVKLVKKLTDTQIIFTTHNTDLMSNDLLRPDAYFQIQNNQIKPFDELTEKEIRRAHNIQKMYKAGSFNE